MLDGCDSHSGGEEVVGGVRPTALEAVARAVFNGCDSHSGGEEVVGGVRPTAWEAVGAVDVPVTAASKLNHQLHVVLNHKVVPLLGHAQQLEDVDWNRENHKVVPLLAHAQQLEDVDWNRENHKVVPLLAHAQQLEDVDWNTVTYKLHQ